MKPKAQVEYRPIKDLKELPGNPRTIKKDQFEKLKKSIKDNADYFEARPIILSNRTGELVILAGNQRYKAAKAIGMKEVPTILLEGLSEEREREIIIRDNVENGDWDWDELANTWDAARLTDWGVQMPDWASETEPEIVEGEAPEPPAEPKSKLGEIYQLGNHRLMVGDSTKVEQVAELMGGVTADMVFTDPPYNMSYSGKGIIKASRFGNLKERISGIIDFDPKTISWLAEEKIGNVCIFTSKDLIRQYIDIFAGWKFNLLVWEKTNVPPFLNNNFLPDIEYLLYFHRGERVWNNGIEPTSIYKKVFSSPAMEGKKDAGEDLHPTMKPIRIISDKIRIMSRNGGAVLDPFGGSGSTLIACEQLNRKCYMMELDPHYADVIIERWEKFTGKKAEKIKEAA